MAEHFCAKGRMTAAADAAHCGGIWPQSCGTKFEVVGYDTNNHLFPLVFGHFVGPGCIETWRSIFSDCAKIGVPLRTTIVDLEKSIDNAYRDCMSAAKLFLNPLHDMQRSSHCEETHGIRIGSRQSRWYRFIRKGRPCNDKRMYQLYTSGVQYSTVGISREI